MSAALRGRAQRALGVPAPSYAPPCQVICNTGLFGRPRQTYFLATNDNSHRSSSIARLIFCSGPSAVLLRIRTIIINAVQRSAYRPIAHVPQEGTKPAGLPINYVPLSAYFYTPTPVIAVSDSHWRVTSFSHRGPNPVKRIIAHREESARQVSVDITQTTATRLTAFMKRLSCDQFTRATVAQTRDLSRLSNFRQNREPTVSVIKRFRLRHDQTLAYLYLFVNNEGSGM